MRVGSGRCSGRQGPAGGARRRADHRDPRGGDGARAGHRAGRAAREDPATARRNLDAFTDQAVELLGHHAHPRRRGVPRLARGRVPGGERSGPAALPHPALTPSSCSRSTPPRAWSGTTSYVPGLNQDDFPSKNSSAWTGTPSSPAAARRRVAAAGVGTAGG
ncbi:hypothetical protein QJS66_22430 [Kocuria rhizophila]|nr:hypothetical protein QJS66_22430 [Kocuria rhizophila]